MPHPFSQPTQLYLLRHADADTIAPSDDERFLSEKGIVQAQRVARFCEAHGIAPQIVFTSPLRRAHQTAAIVAEKLHTELRTVRWLACGAQPAATLQQVQEYRTAPALMLVGHEPDLSFLAAHLLGASDSANIHVRKASLLAFTVFEFQVGGARLEFSLPARMV